MTEAATRYGQLYCKLYHSTVKYVYGVFSNMRYEDVEDAVSESFEKALDTDALLFSEAAARNWLIKTSCNALRVRYRHTKRHSSIEDESTIPRHYVLDSRIEYSETLDRIDRLPTHLRTVMGLAVLEYLPEEISGELGISRNAVYKRLTEARKRLSRNAIPDPELHVQRIAA